MKKIIITITLLTMATLSMAQFHYDYETDKLYSPYKPSEIVILVTDTFSHTVKDEIDGDTKQRMTILYNQTDQYIMDFSRVMSCTYTVYHQTPDGTIDCTITFHSTKVREDNPWDLLYYR